MSTLPSISTNGSAGPKDPVARGLGAFSVALGVPQLVAPGRMNRMIGVRDDAVSRAWMRAVGVREIVAGTGIFATRRPNGWVWARIAGDTMDLALLASALRSRKRSKDQGRTLAATGAVIGAFAADLVDGVRLQRAASNGGPAEEEQDRPMHVKAAITVRRDRGELYALWRDFERFPSFMAHLEEVTSTAPGRSHWTARGPLGMTVSWDAEITEDVAGERIAWRSLAGAKVENSGRVRFADAPAGQGTEIHVELRYAIPGGTVGASIAKLLGEEPAIGVRDDLRRFKQIAETGEIVRSDGSPEGQLGRRQLKPRPATPLPEEELSAAGIEGTS